MPLPASDAPVEQTPAWDALYEAAKAAKGERQANSIWPWSGGYRPSMQTLMQQLETPGYLLKIERLERS